MAASLTDLERLKIRVELEDLNTAFCYHLDHNEVDALLELFTDDVYYTHGSRVSRGKAELAEVFHNRGATQTRTARHLYSGLKLDIESATRARGTSVCMTFGAYGEPPLSPAIPTLVADLVDAYARGADGRWRIAERHIHRIFVAPDNPGPIGMK
jgi:ketosteroid isomerase-like protein